MIFGGGIAGDGAREIGGNGDEPLKDGAGDGARDEGGG